MEYQYVIKAIKRWQKNTGRSVIEAVDLIHILHAANGEESQKKSASKGPSLKCFTPEQLIR